ncbi:MAG TPA: hypothetical protein VGD52_16810 [Pseudoduganella sp.]
MEAMTICSKKFGFILASMALAGSAVAASGELVKGKLVDGGGGDDMGVTILSDQGKKINAYCAGQCGDWFVAAADGEYMTLNPKLKGKAVTATIATERNAGRVAGPGDDERFKFIKRITLAK